MRRINERGEIVNIGGSQPSNPDPFHSFPIGPTEREKNRYFTITLIVSPIIYSIVGIILNNVLTLHWEPFFAFVVGGVFGLIVTAIYNFAYSKMYTTQDYLLSLTLPGLILAAIGIGLIILGVLLALFILMGLLSGGG